MVSFHRINYFIQPLTGIPGVVFITLRICWPTAFDVKSWKFAMTAAGLAMPPLVACPAMPRALAFTLPTTTLHRSLLSKTAITHTLAPAPRPIGPVARSRRPRSVTCPPCHTPTLSTPSVLAPQALLPALAAPRPASAHAHPTLRTT